VGGNFVDVSPGGVAINGTMVLINSGGAPARGPGAHPQEPADAKEAEPDEPEEADDAKSGEVSGPVERERKGPPQRG
jgi:type VI secretion system secreted protein VgrG